MPQNIAIENTTDDKLKIHNYTLHPHSLNIVPLHFSAEHSVKYTITHHNKKKASFTIDENGQIKKISCHLVLNNTPFSININKSLGTGTGYYWSTETNVSPIYIKPNTRLIIT